MSYIEEKYKAEILKIFEDLVKTEEDISEILKKKSLKETDNIARLLADVNKKINLILKKYYPEIKEMSDKLEIKSKLKFYYDLMDKLIHFVRNVENFQKIDDQYYEHLIDFILDKDYLISGKYKQICSNELTAFYDKKSRENLERILEQKFAKRERGYFAMGPLEEELKKIGKIAGASELTILSAKDLLDSVEFISNPKSAINYSILSTNDFAKLEKIGEELKGFLESKGYKVLIISAKIPELEEEREILTGTIVTDAKLLPD